ncbi:LOW QUALITY PROTEIN: hypothetical protein ACHAXR_005151, partial [Thalassiosira sp. AJA248-18]
MTQEGVSSKIIEAVVGKDSNVSSNESKDKRIGPALKLPNNRKTVALHWTTTHLPPERFEQSIFGRAKAISPEKEANIEELEEVFRKRNTKNEVWHWWWWSKRGHWHDMAEIFDLARANNIAISLKAFKSFTFPSLAKTINDLDPKCKILGEHIQCLPYLLPTPNEI